MLPADEQARKALFRAKHITDQMAHWRARSDERAQCMRVAADAGMSVSEIARYVGLTGSTVWDLVEKARGNGRARPRPVQASVRPSQQIALNVETGNMPSGEWIDAGLRKAL